MTSVSFFYGKTIQTFLPVQYVIFFQKRLALGKNQIIRMPEEFDDTLIEHTSTGSIALFHFLSQLRLHPATYTSLSSLVFLLR